MYRRKKEHIKHGKRIRKKKTWRILIDKSKGQKPSSQLSLPMIIRFITNANYLIIPQLPHYNENFNVIHINSMS